MLWKEMHVERSSALGGFGKVLGIFVLTYLAVGSLALAAFALSLRFWSPRPTGLDGVTSLIDRMYGDTGGLFTLLMALAVGLRASVAVSSERERGTWEALLTSPLGGREILGGKLWGSLHGLRWLFASVLLAWGVAFSFGAMRGGELANHIAQTLVLGLFAASVGVRASLACGTATRAMSVTVGVFSRAYCAALGTRGPDDPDDLHDLPAQLDGRLAAGVARARDSPVGAHARLRTDLDDPDVRGLPRPDDEHHRRILGPVRRHRRPHGGRRSRARSRGTAEVKLSLRGHRVGMTLRRIVFNSAGINRLVLHEPPRRWPRVRQPPSC